ncbi:hypothetical protein MKW98_029347, partial [Papaver atlanticum]
MSGARELSDDSNHGSHEQVIEIKALLKMLVESQAKLAETQANTQQQIIEILNRSNNSAANNHNQQGTALIIRSV